MPMPDVTPDERQGRLNNVIPRSRIENHVEMRIDYAVEVGFVKGSEPLPGPPKSNRRRPVSTSFRS